MKHFMYMILRTKPDRNGNRRGELKLWTIKRNTPEFVGTYYFTFQSDDQALMNAVKQFKLLPRKYLDMSPFELKEKKIAIFH